MIVIIVVFIICELPASANQVQQQHWPDTRWLRIEIRRISKSLLANNPVTITSCKTSEKGLPFKAVIVQCFRSGYSESKSWGLSARAGGGRRGVGSGEGCSHPRYNFWILHLRMEHSLLSELLSAFKVLLKLFAPSLLCFGIFTRDSKYSLISSYFSFCLLLDMSLFIICWVILCKGHKIKIVKSPPSLLFRRLQLGSTDLIWHF